MSLTDPSKTWKPHLYPWAIEAAVEHEQMHWGAWEANLQDDVNDWHSGKMTAVDKAHTQNILTLFTQSDMTISDNYTEYFIPVFKNNEIRHMLMSFANREMEHTRSYALLNDTLGLGDESYTVFTEYAQMRDKLEHMAFNDISSKKGRGLALAKTVINEGVSLFAAFAMLLNYDRFGKMKGMSEINRWSLNDELFHAMSMAKLFRVYCDENPRIVNDAFKKEIYDMVRKAIELEDGFLDLAYGLGNPEGLTKDEVKHYIRYLADRRLIQIGLKPNYGIKDNPLPWMDWFVTGDSFGSFFERRITDYSKAGLSGDDWGYDDKEAA